MSLDAILARLHEDGWERVPSRASVQNVIRDWDNLPGEIRQRDVPFKWRQLEMARIPWEASEWVLECKFQHEQLGLSILHEDPANELSSKERAVTFGAFTNRWATWCWRLHQAAPDLNPSDILAMASSYVYRERAQDLGGTSKVMDVAGIDDWLAYRPGLEDGRTFPISKEASDVRRRRSAYEEALRRGMASPIPDMRDDFASEQELREGLSGGPPIITLFYLLGRRALFMKRGRMFKDMKEFIQEVRNFFKNGDRGSENERSHTQEKQE